MQPVPASTASSAGPADAVEPVASSAAPAVWAIVLMYGGEEITAACIDSLLAQDYSSLTVLLVDNASEDGSGERLRDRYSDRIEYLNTRANLGYTGGNNRGMERALAAGADYVLVVNNDTVLEPRCVSLLVESAQRADRPGAVAPKILYHGEPGRIWYAGGDYSYMKALGLHRRESEQDTPSESGRLDEITFVTGCCLLVPADVVRAVGGFREDFFMYCEDVEWSLRTRRAGLRLYYQPAARMYHRQETTGALASAFAALHRDRNRRRLVQSHYSWWQRLAFSMWFYPTRVARSVQYALSGNFAGARAIIAASFGPLGQQTRSAPRA